MTEGNNVQSESLELDIAYTGCSKTSDIGKEHRISNFKNALLGERV